MIDRVRALIAPVRAWAVRLIAQIREWALKLISLRPVRAALRYNHLRGNRLAGAVSFYGFISLFPMLALAGAITFSVLGPDALDSLQEAVNENLPGMTLDVSAFARNASTVGIIGAIALLWTGLMWVDATRAAVRSMWELDDRPGTFVVRKLIDFVAFVGLGVAMLISWSATVIVSAATDWLIDLLGFEGDFVQIYTRLVALSLAIGSSSLIFGYMLAGLPRIRIPPRVLIPAALAGGLAFEGLKQIIARYTVLVAPDNTYAAFSLPLALIAWIYVVTRVIMFLAAASAEWVVGSEDEARQRLAL